MLLLMLRLVALVVPLLVMDHRKLHLSRLLVALAFLRAVLQRRHSPTSRIRMRQVCTSAQ
jgi:hypothetical protein